MTKKPTYSDLLQDPRWKLKRNEIVQRDNHTCCCCGKSCYELHVHHLKYLEFRNPWDYPNHLLITLCEFCHCLEHMHEKYGYGFVDGIKNRKGITSEPTHIKDIMPSVLKDLEKMVLIK
jgi:5-methylcytosine-specific restriction endonuclease McrA